MTNIVTIIVAVFSVYKTNIFLRERQNEQDETNRTLRLYEEFESKHMVDSRLRMIELFKKLEDEKKKYDYHKIRYDKDSPNEYFDDLHKVLHFFEKVSILKN
ncbi:MAG: hypothetical protein AAFQ80_22320 [Cyanobacteria bacterium J06621_8]